MDNSPLLKRPAAGKFGGYTMYAASGAAQAIADDIILAADAGGAITATATQAVTVSQSANAALLIAGTAAQSVAIVQAASGALAVQGTESANVLVAQSAAGTLAIQGSGEQAVTIQQSATGAGESEPQAAASSGVARLIAAQDWYWNPKPAIVMPFVGMPRPEARKTATAPVAQPKPQTFDLLEALSEAERETVDAESKLRVVDQAAAQVVDALRRMAKVATLEKQAVQLDVVREAKKRAAIRKRIQAEDEMIIMALLAA